MDEWVQRIGGMMLTRKPTILGKKKNYPFPVLLLPPQIPHRLVGG